MAKTQTDPEPAEQPAGGKGRPTPSRREREAANKRPIVVADRSEARRISREQDRVERARQSAGYAAGDERYLPVRDRGPQRRWVRDYVDARLSAGEFVIPVMFLVIVVMYLPFPAISAYATVALIGYFGLVIIDSVVLGLIVRRRLAAKYGADRVEKVRWYAAMRALQLRLMRLPKPQVKRFRFPD
ncbi:MAG: hypothetical protein BGO95_00200 [Micrococcales bacterium 73-13]|mgnify:CR=1 FL=1|nr:MAG: hypothetical protein BGO95_00200 [Micrococcales bacterium 73-13]